MEEEAEEQCGKGNAKVCRTACEDCGNEKVTTPTEARHVISLRRFLGIRINSSDNVLLNKLKQEPLDAVY